MTQPSVTITQLDGALGVLPPSAGALFALIGASSSGPTAVPATYARVRDIVAAYGAGPLVEAACHYVERYGRPVVLVRTGTSTAGTMGTVVVTGVAGTSVVTATSGAAPVDDYEVVVRIVTGGTRGTAGITYRVSLDGGRNFGPVLDLGTATALAISGAGVSFDLATGTLLAGDVWTCRTTAPNANGTELGAALDALFATTVTWELCHIVGRLDGTLFDVADPKFTGAGEVGKYRAWIGSFRMPTVGETPAQYLTAFSTAFGSKATRHGMVCAGAAWITSSVSGRRFLRPAAFAIAAREAAVSQEINTADVNLGPLPGVSIRDDAGNPLHHDESVNPGLDDARACVLRTWDGVQGVYVNRPRLLSPDGSDYQILPHRRVLNIALAVLRQYFVRRLNKPVRVDRTTGFILEADALEIEAGATAAMRAALLAKPKASAVQFSLSRTDNLLSSKTMTGSARVIPLAYPEFINLDVGFLNPALAIQAV
jgi:hypothetical protein